MKLKFTIPFKFSKYPETLMIELIVIDLYFVVINFLKIFHIILILSDLVNTTFKSNNNLSLISLMSKKLGIS